MRKTHSQTVASESAEGIPAEAAVEDIQEQADQETDINEAEKKLRQYALKQNIVLDDTVFCVLLDVYGEYIIDLYIPIKERSAA